MGENSFENASKVEQVMESPSENICLEAGKGISRE